MLTLNHPCPHCGAHTPYRFTFNLDTGSGVAQCTHCNAVNETIHCSVRGKTLFVSSPPPTTALVAQFTHDARNTHTPPATGGQQQEG